jgi:hypothetical protein
MNTHNQHVPEPPPAIYYYEQHLGSDISTRSLQKSDKHILLGLITHLHVYGLVVDRSEEPIQISRETYQSAFMFTERLPQGVPMPLASPDGDGGLLLSWSKPDGKMHLIVDGFTLLLTERAGRDDVFFHDPVAFDGEQLPLMTLKAIVA